MATISVKPIRWEAAPTIEVRVKDGQCTVFDKATKTFWPSAANLTLGNVFDRCVWKGTNGNVACRLFRGDNHSATFVAVDLTNKKLHTFKWNNDFNDETLKTKYPTLQVNENGTSQVTWQNFAEPRAEAFDPAADADVIRGDDFRIWGLKVAGWAVGSACVVKVGYVAGSALCYGIYDYILAPVANLAVDNLGVPGAIGATLATGVLTADRYLPEYRILPTIQEVGQNAYNAVKARVPS